MISILRDLDLAVPIAMEVQDRQLWTMVESLDLIYCYCGYSCCYHLYIIKMLELPDLPNPILAQHQHPQVDQGLQAGYVVQPEIIHIVSLEVKMSSR